MADTPEELTQIAKDYGVTWTLETCARKATNIRCTFTLNPSMDMGYRVDLGSTTKFVNVEGNEYFASKAQVGKNVAGRDNSLSFNLTMGSRYKMTIDFKDIPTSIPYATLLQVTTPNYGGDSGVVRFRNVPFVNPDGTYSEIPRPPKPTPVSNPSTPTAPRVCLPIIGCL